MITSTCIGTHGRLGNQFFQYAFLIGASLKHNLPICLPDLTVQIANNQPCLLQNFNLQYNSLNYNDIIHNRNEIELITDNIFNTFNPANIENVLPGTNFFGLYQSYRYWIDFKSEVKKQFTVKNSQITQQAKEFILNIRNTYNKKIIAIHLRRGDVTGWYNYSEYKKYLKNVLQQLKDAKDCYYCIFTGGAVSRQSDIDDIEWVKEFYKELPHFEIIQTFNPIIDFELIQHCDEIILGYISTFAWWAAFLSEKPVFAPTIFNCNENIRLNYYPPGFKLI